MPVLGSPTRSVDPALGVRIPPGSLDTWKAARDLHASALAEVVFEGDSTLFGQTDTGAPGTFAPIPNKMRELLIADGYTSAGRGWPHAGVIDEASLAGPLDPVCFTARTGFALNDSYGMAYSFKSDVQNDEVTLRGKGTICRLWTQPMNIGGAYTYSVNGAAAVTVSAGTNQTVPPGYIYLPNFVYLTGLPGGGAVNTIRVVNTGTGRVGVIAEFFNPAGIVIHNHGIQGASSFAFYTGATDNNIDFLARLGLARVYSETRPSEQMLPDTTTGARRPKLTLCQYGVNDCQGSSNGDVLPYMENLGMFCRMSRNAGADPVIVIPVMERLTHGRTYGTRFREAAHAVAAAYNVATVDANAILGPIATWARWGDTSDSGTNPHLAATMYDAIATAIHTYIIKAP